MRCRRSPDLQSRVAADPMVVTLLGEQRKALTIRGRGRGEIGPWSIPNARRAPGPLRQSVPASGRRRPRRQ